MTKQLFFILTVALAGFVASAAVPAKRLARFVTTEDHRTVTFRYDEATGRIASLHAEPEEGYDEEAFDVTYDWSRLGEGIVKTFSTYTSSENIVLYLDDKGRLSRAV